MANLACLCAWFRSFWLATAPGAGEGVGIGAATGTGAGAGAGGGAEKETGAGAEIGTDGGGSHVCVASTGGGAVGGRSIIGCVGGTGCGGCGGAGDIVIGDGAYGSASAGVCKSAGAMGDGSEDGSGASGTSSIVTGGGPPLVNCWTSGSLGSSTTTSGSSAGCSTTGLDSLGSLPSRKARRMRAAWNLANLIFLRISSLGWPHSWERSRKVAAALSVSAVWLARQVSQHEQGGQEAKGYGNTE